MPTPGNSPRFEEAMRRIDAANCEDPNKESYQGLEYSKEWLYSERMSLCLEGFEPDSSEELRLAVRAQHICRWVVPRATYPMDREGYHRWRTDLGRFHAELTGAILLECGYDAATIQRVGSLLRKERFKTDSEAQTLEDVACLVFLKWYSAEFAELHSDEKVISILARTWKKMSDHGHEAALSLDLAPGMRALVERALASKPLIGE